MSMTFEELAATAPEQNNLEDGGDCPEDGCDESVAHWDHSMDAQFGTRPNVEAPENELVCPVHGIVDSYNN